jgi:hypothetical protein
MGAGVHTLGGPGAARLLHGWLAVAACRVVMFHGWLVVTSCSVLLCMGSFPACLGLRPALYCCVPACLLCLLYCHVYVSKAVWRTLTGFGVMSISCLV